MSCVQIQFAIDDPAKADEIVASLLTERIVACGQRIGPMISRYWWKGSLEDAEEWLVLLKTSSELTSQVTDAIVKCHPYETPEVIALAIIDGSPEYLDWISNSLRAL